MYASPKQLALFFWLKFNYTAERSIRKKMTQTKSTIKKNTSGCGSQIVKYPYLFVKRKTPNLLLQNATMKISIMFALYTVSHCVSEQASLPLQLLFYSLAWRQRVITTRQSKHLVTKPDSLDDRMIIPIIFCGELLNKTHHTLSQGQMG